MAPYLTHMKNNKPRGFTLTELLVSITIIIILAAIIFTSSSRAINNSQKAVCVSNFRGIAGALQMYTIDRAGRLPGPLNTGQSARYMKTDSRSLLTFIAEYMEGDNDVTDGPYLVQNYGCPSLLKKISGNTITSPAVVYRLEPRGGILYSNAGEDITYPWGYNAAVIPKRIDQISPRSAGRVIAITEQDQTMGGTWTNNGASGPAHGNQRMALFWDMSVRPVNLSVW
jgi:prepilin-type N-terminal cleavage/methylation domain-containing protein